MIAYSPLAQGLLGSNYTVDHRPGGVRAANPLFGTENLRRIARDDVRPDRAQPRGASQPT